MKYYFYFLALLLAHGAAATAAAGGSCSSSSSNNNNHNQDLDLEVALGIDHDQSVLGDDDITGVKRCTGKLCQTDNDCRRFKCPKNRRNCVCTQVMDGNGVQKRACGCGVAPPTHLDSVV